VHELAYTEYLDSLCECGVPRSVCQDRTKAWLVDYRIGYRCKALMRVQEAQAKRDEPYLKSGGSRAEVEARKWIITEYDMTRESPDEREDSPG